MGGQKRPLNTRKRALNIRREVRSHPTHQVHHGYVNKHKFLLKKISIEIIIPTKFKEVCIRKSTAFNDAIFLKSLLKVVSYNW